MEYLVLGVLPFAIGLAIALALRHHLKVVALLAVCVLVPYVLYAREALASEAAYAALGAVILGIVAACWLAGMAIGALVAGVRRARLS